MAFEKETTCPECKKEDADRVAYVYKTLVSKGAGRRMFDETLIRDKAKGLSDVQKQRLLKRLMPPEEPKTALPAGVLALMALLLSWLATASLIIGRIGERMYFIISAVATLIIGMHFYITLRDIIKDFTRKIGNYRRVMVIWNQQYFCNNCHHIFIPEKDHRLLTPPKFPKDKKN